MKITMDALGEKRGVITGRKGYFCFLTAITLIVGALSIFNCITSRYGMFFKVLFLICGIILFIIAPIMFRLSLARIELYQNGILVKSFVSRIVLKENIEYFDWKWFDQKNGNCYLYLNNEPAMVLQKSLFKKALFNQLSAFADASGILQKGLD